ncbi:hypothetical protein ACQ86B_28970 (plasmid) [Mycolicibacterium aichiense]|uniref:hypothetical protein n=1 Tax=Mycolicibacterium aichiense TaxID=1799 RepID=UPI003D667120
MTGEITSGDASEGIFYMKPLTVIEAYARVLVDDQKRLAHIRRQLASADDTSDWSEHARAVVQRWSAIQLPNIAATMCLALEVLDTYGPEGVQVQDSVEAAVWNNKFFAWRNEFNPRAPGSSA